MGRGEDTKKKEDIELKEDRREGRKRGQNSSLILSTASSPKNSSHSLCYQSIQFNSIQFDDKAMIVNNKIRIPLCVHVHVRGYVITASAVHTKVSCQQVYRCCVGVTHMTIRVLRAIRRSEVKGEE